MDIYIHDFNSIKSTEILKVEMNSDLTINSH